MGLPQKIKQRLFNQLRKYFKLEYGEWSYSQEGEDLVLLELFGGQESGFYVDVGAFHPRRFSNTYRFYKRGWSGINIDPTPGSMAEFRKERPRDISLEMGVSNEAKCLRFFEFSDPALNTFSEETANQRKSHFDLVSTVELECGSLQVILKKWMPPDTPIDFLDVDVEGFDMEVLESNDWDVFRPKVVLVEALESPRMDIVLDDPKSRFLSALGYSPIAKTYRTVFFVDESFLRKFENQGVFEAEDEESE